MIAENIQNIGKKLENACLQAGRNPKEVQLIAVSKTFGVDSISEALDAGCVDFGENYVQELVRKKELLKERNIRWHFIGHLQTNKVKYISEWVHLIHSVDSESVAREIHKRGEKLGRKIDVLIEVNTSRESTKFGVEAEKAHDLMRNVTAYSYVNLRGLMTIGPFTDDADQSRAAFRLLKSLFDEANSGGSLHQPLTILSMGMSHDYAIAIQEGSTMVRIGTAIFGARSQHLN